MKRFQLLVLAVLLTSSAGKAQYEFGKVTPDEIKTIPELKDNSAEAVVLFDIGRSYYILTDEGFEVMFERRTRIKILTEAGLDWAEVAIPFYRGGNIYEEITNIEANTYNLENNNIIVKKFNPGNCYDEKVNERWNLKKFALPNVKAGSVIEYKYRLRSQDVFNLRDWEFQWRIPVLYSECQVEMIPFYEYRWILWGSTRFDSQTSQVAGGLERQFASIFFRDRVHNFVMKNVPAFNDEEFISSPGDYMIRLDFQLARVNHPYSGKQDVITTWPEMISDLLTHNQFGGYLKKSEKLAKNHIDTEKMKDDAAIDRFNHVMDYVKDNFNWNGKDGRLASKSPGEFARDKTGNCTDINLFATGLLNAAGIEAWPVIISTRDHGKIKTDYPFLHFFNYVLILAVVDGKNILADATLVFNPNHKIPPRCINDKGLLIIKGEENWVTLATVVPSAIQHNFIINVSGEAEMNTQIKVTATDYDALHYRNTAGDDKMKITEMISKKGFTIDESTIRVENQYDIEKPYILGFELDTKAEVINDKIYISPFLNEPMSDNPLKQQTRTYPVDMIYPAWKTFISTISIPEGYKVDHIPENLSLKNDLYELSYGVSQNEGNIFIAFSYFFKKAVYSPNEYTRIKLLFNEVIRKGNEKVVLSRT